MTISSAGLIGNWGRWIPNLLTGSRALPRGPHRAARNVYGVADKVLAMALSSLLLGAGKRRPLWFEVGATFVAVDTLVHNFLHRTGILRRLCADHPYGDKCYRPGGCAGILGLLAANIDAREFNPAFPATFPGSCRARSGATAPRTASAFATAIASTTTPVAPTGIANYFAAVTEFA